MSGSSAVPRLTSTSAGRVMSAAMTEETMTALAGTLRPLRRAHLEDPGTAPSRLKAKSIGLVDVMYAAVQKNCPTLAMSRTVPAQPDDSAWLKMTATPPPPAVTASA